MKNLLIFIKIGSGPAENSILSEMIYAMTSDMAIDMTCDVTMGGKVNLIGIEQYCYRENYF